MSTSYYLRNRSDFEEFADYSRFLSGLEKELNQKDIVEELIERFIFHGIESKILSVC